MLGPTIVPVCQAIELTAIAVGRTSRGTRLGASAEKERQGQVPGPRQQAQRGCVDGEQQCRRTGDPAPVERICDKSHHGCEEEKGHELGEPDHSQEECGLPDIHRLTRDAIDLPADDDLLCADRDGREQAGHEIGPKIGDRQRVRGSAHTRGHDSRRRTCQASVCVSAG